MSQVDSITSQLYALSGQKPPTQATTSDSITNDLQQLSQTLPHEDATAREQSHQMEYQQNQDQVAQQQQAAQDQATAAGQGAFTNFLKAGANATMKVAKFGERIGNAVYGDTPGDFSGTPSVQNTPDFAVRPGVSGEIGNFAGNIIGGLPGMVASTGQQYDESVQARKNAGENITPTQAVTGLLANEAPNLAMMVSPAAMIEKPLGLGGIAANAAGNMVQRGALGAGGQMVANAANGQPLMQDTGSAGLSNAVLGGIEDSTKLPKQLQTVRKAANEVKPPETLTGMQPAAHQAEPFQGKTDTITQQLQSLAAAAPEGQTKQPLPNPISKDIGSTVQNIGTSPMGGVHSYVGTDESGNHGYEDSGGRWRTTVSPSGEAATTRQDSRPITPELKTEHEHEIWSLEQDAKKDAATRGQERLPTSLSDMMQTAQKQPLPNDELRASAADYAAKQNRPYNPPSDREAVNPEEGKKIADAYEKMQHNPNDPAVKQSYDALKAETLDQYNHLKAAGYNFNFEPDASKINLNDVHDQIANKNLSVWSGSGDMPADHPLMQEVPGQPGLKYNDIFRAVHDVYGHGKEGLGFDAEGEHNAWRQHAAMYSPEAQEALKTETRGQNSWVNYGPHGEANRANPGQETFPPQKAGLLPETQGNQEPSVLQRVLNKGKEFLGSESGSSSSEHSFVHQTLLPAMKGVAKALHLDDLGSYAKRLVRSTPQSLRTNDDIRAAIGDSVAKAHALAATIEPHAQMLDDWDIRKQAQWLDQSDNGVSPDPRLQPAADAIQAIRKQAAELGKKLGIDNLDAEGLGFSHNLVPDEKAEQSPTGGNSLAGSNSRLMKQRLTAEEAYTTPGMKSRTGNVLRDQTVSMMQLFHNLHLREEMQAHEDNGIAQWVPDGQSPDKDHPTQVKDPILGRDTREAALPNHVMAQAQQIAEDKGYHASQQFVEQQLRGNDVKYVRHGTDVPEGYHGTGVKVKGNMFTDDDTAGHFDARQKLPPSKGFFGMMQGLARAATIAKYTLSGLHAVNGLRIGFTQALKEATSFAKAGNMGQAKESLLDALQGGTRRARQFKNELRTNPDAAAEGTAGRIALRTNVGSTEHILLPQKKIWQPMFDSFKNGNPIAVAGNAIKGTSDLFHQATFRDVLGNVALGRALARAEVLGDKNMAEDIIQRHANGAVDRVSQLLGHSLSHSEANRDSIGRRVASTFIPASHYYEGLLRLGAGAITGDKESMALVASHITGRALLGIATGLAVSTLMGHPHVPHTVDDLLDGPQIGPPDEDGNVPRLRDGDPLGRAYRMFRPLVKGDVSGVGKEMAATVNPLVSGSWDVIQNKDWQGNQVRPDDASYAGNFLRGAGHIGEGMLPISVNQLMTGGSGDTSLANKATSLTGQRVAHTQSSDAMQDAYDTLDKVERGGRNLAAQNLHENEGKWVAQARSGDKAGAIAAMKADASVSPETIKSVMRRAAEKPGIPGLVTDTQFTPADLTRFWGKMTDQEKAEAKDPILKRINSATDKDGISLQERREWNELRQELSNG
jgi:hypothetical protein